MKKRKPKTNHNGARRKIKQAFCGLLLPFCWFAPASFLRVFFHRLRGVKIGKGVEIGYFVVIDHLFPDWVEIGSGAVVSLGSKIIAHDDVRRRKLKISEREPKRVIIGKNVTMGFDTVILPGVVIGDNALIGTKSLINKSIKKNDIVAGVPAKSIKQ